MTKRQTKFGRRDVNDAEQTLTLLSPDIRLSLRKGMCLAPTARHSVSAWGAAQEAWQESASAESAIHVSLSGIRKSIDATEARLQRLVIGLQLDPGALPQARR